MTAPPPKGRLSLYEDRISESSRAEIQAREEQKAAAEAAKKKKDASFMFKPTSLSKKPNNNAKAKPKPKPSFVNMHKMSSSTSTSTGEAPVGLASSDAPQPPGPAKKRNFNDWLDNDDDEDVEYYNSRPQHSRNKKSKKNYNKKGKSTQQLTWTYDDIYDPSVPVDLTHYAKSDAAFQSREAWKMRLYNANKKELRRLGKTAKVLPAAKVFAPAKAMFAPPAELTSGGDVRPHSSGSSSYRRDESDRDYDDMPRTSYAKPSFAPPASLAPTTVNLNREETADEAYARRLALSSKDPVAPSQPVSVPQQVTPAKTATPEDLEKQAQAMQKIAAFKAMMAAKKEGRAAAASLSKPDPAPESEPGSNAMQGFVSAAAPERQTTRQEDLDAIQLVVKQPNEPERDLSPEITITTNQLGMPSSRGPISDPSAVTFGRPVSISGAPTYNYGFPGIAPQMDARIANQPSPSNIPAAPAAEEDAEERSKRPGQTGFAERLLMQQGWKRGQGLGASNEGITSAIVMNVDKSKTTKARTVGKFVGGRKKAPTDDRGGTPHGLMSEVVKLEGMLKGMDVDHEIKENNLMQEIGDDMSENYGKVERVFIWEGHLGGKDEVFVRFESQLSAMKAVKGMNGADFAGNKLTARYWDKAKFEAAEYS